MSFSKVTECMRRLLHTTPMSSYPLSVLIEGNIASGKTRLIDYFRRQCNEEEMQIVTEPVNEWRDMNGHNLLALCYENPSKNGFLFQSYAQLTNFRLHAENAHGASFKLMERSVFSGREVFVRVMRENNILSASEFSLYLDYFDAMYERLHKQMPVDLIVYLRTDPQRCLERLQERAKCLRQEENCIPLTYLQQLHEAHERWLCPIEGTYKQVPPCDRQTNCRVITINVEEHYDRIEQQYGNLWQTMQAMRRGK